jgi:hypothetical protein
MEAGAPLAQRHGAHAGLARRTTVVIEPRSGDWWRTEDAQAPMHTQEGQRARVAQYEADRADKPGASALVDNASHPGNADNAAGLEALW